MVAQTNSKFSRYSAVPALMAEDVAGSRSVAAVVGAAVATAAVTDGAVPEASGPGSPAQPAISSVAVRAVVSRLTVEPPRDHHCRRRRRLPGSEGPTGTRARRRVSGDRDGVLDPHPDMLRYGSR